MKQQFFCQAKKNDLGSEYKKTLHKKIYIQENDTGEWAVKSINQSHV